MTLPSSTKDFTEKKWVNLGWLYLLNGVIPADPECVEAIVASMMKEIGSKFAITMGQPAPPLRLSGRGAGETRYIVVGASHATGLAEAFQITGP
jgi:hypothetical protein